VRSPTLDTPCAAAYFGDSGGTFVSYWLSDSADISLLEKNVKNSTKGALAVGAAAVLLVGGAGTLAYWTDEATVDAGPITAGSIELTALACEGFVYADDTAATLIVPGDVVTNDCDATLVLVGDNIGATLAIDPTSLPADNALAEELDAEVTLLDEAGAEVAAITGAGTYTLTAQIEVAFGYGGPVSDPPDANADNDSQGGTVDLAALELVAVQTNTDLP
jgi:alternate signal-mediated exported protein